MLQSPSSRSGGALPLICNTVLKGCSWNLQINATSGYLLYVLAGYLIATCEFDKRTRYVIYIASIVGLMMHVVGTYKLSMSAGEIISTFKGYNNAPCIMYSVGIMVWLRHNCGRLMKSKAISTVTKAIQPYTLSIYLLQWFIITIITRAFEFDATSIVYRLGAPVIIITIAIFITWVVRKIPLVKAILP